MLNRCLILIASVTALGLSQQHARAQPGIFSSPTYAATKSITDALTDTTMGLTNDGANYWGVSGGSNDGVREAMYNSAGTNTGLFQPGLDFRSIFTNTTGDVFARQYGDPTIYKQTSPGVFAPVVTLIGGNLDDQSSVVFGPNDSEYDAMSGGVVTRWDLNGNLIGDVGLTGFGTVGSEGNFLSQRGLATFDSYWLTYGGDGTLSAWDSTGSRVGETTLVGAGTSFDSGFGMSAANGVAWVIDNAGGTWSGYDLAPATTTVPEPGAVAMLCGLFVSGAGFTFRQMRRRAQRMIADSNPILASDKP